MHRLNKPVKRVSIPDDLPSLDSQAEDEDSWSSGIDEECFNNSGEEGLFSDNSENSRGHSDSEAEMPYEKALRKRRPWDIEDKAVIQRLPIKSADGRIRQTGVHFSAVSAQGSDDEESGEPQTEVTFPLTRVDDVSTGARFGRAAVVDVVGIQSRKERIQTAKEQIAGICQEIIADPENSVSATKL